MTSMLVRTVVESAHSANERLDAAKLLGWSAATSYTAVFLLPASGSDQRPLTDLRHEVQIAELPLGVVQDGLAGLISTWDTDPLDWCVVRGREHGLVTGTSVLASDGVLDAPAALRRAAWAARVGRAAGRPRARFEELGIDRLLYPGPADDVTYLTRPLTRIRKAAEELGFDPMETLRHYLATGGNIRATAEAMFLHPNTLRYRLDRLARATGLDLSDHEAMFELELALRLDAARAALPAPVNDP
jgi:hypothetical protein